MGSQRGARAGAALPDLYPSRPPLHFPIGAQRAIQQKLYRGPLEGPWLPPPDPRLLFLGACRPQTSPGRGAAAPKTPHGVLGGGSPPTGGWGTTPGVLPVS